MINEIGQHEASEEMREKIIYVSGLVDGEGWIGITRSKPRSGMIHDKFESVLTITNTNEEIINWLLEHFGGKVYKKGTYSPRHKMALTWRKSNLQLIPFLKAIYPYLIIKKKQAETVLKYLEGKREERGRYQVVTEKEFLFRSVCWKEIREMNSRGPCTAATTKPSNFLKKEEAIV